MCIRNMTNKQIYAVNDNCKKIADAMSKINSLSDPIFQMELYKIHLEVIKILDKSNEEMMRRGDELIHSKDLQ